MPQVFNDESIVPALRRQGIAPEHALDYAVVGCVELSSQGNMLGWSDAAMFNLVKTLELALNHGRCLLTGEPLGPDLGGLDTFGALAEVEAALDGQMTHFVERTMRACAAVDRIHAEKMPTAFLSSVVSDCLEKGMDVTAGGARYNFSGIQGIQIANLADSLAALKVAVFDERRVSGEAMLAALRGNFAGREALRQWLLHRAPKYGNDVAWVDELGGRWARRFAEAIEAYPNARGGRCRTGFYTVSAHVPMGRNVGATPDGRFAGAPLADGGLSAVCGRDTHGPTALLRSVSRIPAPCGSNGTLLNLKFLPGFFATPEDRRNFGALLRGLVALGIHHAQFNVVRRADLLAAKADPEKHRHLTVRVAGYTAYFTELAGDLQDEIIARTTFGGDQTE
jgi:formate C-acetyltransferase